MEKEHISVDHDAAALADTVLRKVDRESRYRVLSGNWKLFVTIISCIFVLYHIVTSRFGMPEMFRHRAIHLGFILVLVWLYYPASRRSPYERPSAIDVGLVFLTTVLTVFTYFNIETFAMRGGIAVTMDYVTGGICCLLVLEACRRVVGPQLFCLVLVFLLYAYFGRYFPGVLMHKGYNLKRIIYQMYLTTQGLFGIPLGVSATYMIIFVVLASTLSICGLGKLFNDVSLALGGRLVGGPAKVAVIASAMMGTISGGAATNVATTGAFTIPLMKRVGYVPYFAGAVEAAASTGGQIMPPVMGTVAFIMAEFIGVPYLKIAAAAAIPAVIYFAGVFFQIDLRARKIGLKGLSPDQDPDVRTTVKRYGHMILPIILLVYLMVKQYTPIYAAFYTVIFAWALSFLRRDTWVRWKEARDIAVDAAKSCLSVGVAMASAGFIVGVLGMTGIGLILADNIVALSHGNLPATLVLCMVVSIILGMGLPTSACYIIAISIAGPILKKMGVPDLQAHFFVLYFACLSTVTPPVALASYVGAGLAGADPGKVGWCAFKLAIAGFIVPYFFIYSPAMLLIADGPWTIVFATVTAIAGTALLAVFVEGYMLLALPFWLRLLYLAAALFLIAPGLKTDLGGGVIAALAFALTLMLRRRAAPA